MSDRNDEILRRRRFLKAAVGVTALGLGGCKSAPSPGPESGTAAAGEPTTEPARGRSPAPPHPFVTKPLDRVRMGFVGVGGMGSAHVRNYLKIPNVDIVAVCDINPDAVRRMQTWVKNAGQPEPTGYDRGERDYVRMCEKEDLDLVLNATPWKWHVPICVTAMRTGSHVAVEVPAAITVDGCWELVETAERERKHCVMLENCCYGRMEMMVLNMVRRGLFGEIMHGEAGYLHDLRGIKFSDHGEGLWRRQHSIDRNANLYPTHGLGPVAQCMNVNRGDRFDYVVSMSGNARGLRDFAVKRFGAADPRAKESYACGDVNVSLIRTVNGRTIYLAHDCNLPRPYSRINTVQGTKGIFSGYPHRVHLEGRSKGHGWEEASAYLKEFDHPLWQRLEKQSKGAGHGGMDYLEDFRLIESLRRGEPMDMDVYDAAAWSVFVELTERSVADRSRPIDVPDFTRGRWKTNRPLGIVGA